MFNLNGFSMRLNTHGEIIVYLDYHSKVIDGGGDLILDFRSLDDFTRFVGVFKELSEDNSFKGTYLRITGYITNSSFGFSRSGLKAQ